MVQFGVELRQEREHRGVSLESMCAATKLSLRQLLDVEAGNFRELPGGIFRKGFVRSYLRALSLDEPSWLERYEASYKASGLADAAEVDWTDFAENVRNNRLGGKGSGPTEPVARRPGYGRHAGFTRSVHLEVCHCPEAFHARSGCGSHLVSTAFKVLTIYSEYLADTLFPQTPDSRCYHDTDDIRAAVGPNLLAENWSALAG